MATTTVEVRVEMEAAVQQRAAEVLARAGITLEQATRRMLEQTAEAGYWPLPLMEGEDPEYDEWFRAQVQEALDDPRPPISDEEMRRRMARKRAEAQAGRL